MTLKELSQFDHAQRCKTTSMPSDYVPMNKFSDKTANSFTKAIITYLKLHGCQAERISSMGRVIDETKTFTDAVGFTRKIGSVKYIKGTSTNGTADISATIKGKSVKIEVKIGKDRQSDAQKKYQEDVERAGGIYLIAKDWDGFIQTIKKI
jgi:hypothetical protein